jgi:hypothetical protein
VDQLTGPAIIRNLAETLRGSSDGFPESEIRYHKAVEELRASLPEEHTPSLDTYLEAMESDIRSRLVYAGYNGFLANLVNFHQPFGLDFTRKDFFDSVKDHIIGHFPVNYEAARVINEFIRSLPENCRRFEEDIRDYFIHMECTGPKLAHYAGYLIGNQLLPWVEPGYREDYHQTLLYAHEINKYLEKDPFMENHISK